MNDFANETTQETQNLKNTQLKDVASQTSPPKGHLLQNSETATAQFRKSIPERTSTVHQQLGQLSSRQPTN